MNFIKTHINGHNESAPQIRDNFDDTTPPGCSRVLGVFTACLHDAVALVTPYMTTVYAVDTYTENAGGGCNMLWIQHVS